MFFVFRVNCIDQRRSIVLQIQPPIINITRIVARIDSTAAPDAYVRTSTYLSPSRDSDKHFIDVDKLSRQIGSLGKRPGSQPASERERLERGKNAAPCVIYTLEPVCRRCCAELPDFAPRHSFIDDIHPRLYKHTRIKPTHTRTYM